MMVGFNFSRLKYCCSQSQPVNINNNSNSNSRDCLLSTPPSLPSSAPTLFEFDDKQQKSKPHRYSFRNLFRADLSECKTVTREIDELSFSPLTDELIIMSRSPISNSYKINKQQIFMENSNVSDSLPRKELSKLNSPIIITSSKPTEICECVNHDKSVPETETENVESENEPISRRWSTMLQSQPIESTSERSLVDSLTISHPIFPRIEIICETSLEEICSQNSNNSSLALFDKDESTSYPLPVVDYAGLSKPLLVELEMNRNSINNSSCMSDGQSQAKMTSCDSEPEKNIIDNHNNGHSEENKFLYTKKTESDHIQERVLPNEECAKGEKSKTESCPSDIIFTSSQNMPSGDANHKDINYIVISAMVENNDKTSHKTDCSYTSSEDTTTEEESHIKKHCTVMSKEIGTSDEIDEGNNIQYLQNPNSNTHRIDVISYSQKSCKISDGLHDIITQDISEQNCIQSKSKQEDSDEDIPCTQRFQVMTSKTSSCQDRNYQSDLISPSGSLNIHEDELTFSPLYTPVCYENEDVMALTPIPITTVGCPPLTSSIMKFSPLISVESSLACKIPLQKEDVSTDRLRLSPDFKSTNTESKSEYKIMQDTHFVDIVTSRKFSSEENQNQYHENFCCIDEKTSDNLKYFNNTENSSSSSHSRLVSENLNSHSSDDIPALAIFSPLSSCTIKKECELDCKIVEENLSRMCTSLQSQYSVKEMNFMINQIVPDCDTSYQERLHKNVITSKEKDCIITDLKPYDDEACKKPVGEEIPVIRGYSLGNNEHFEKNHYRDQMKLNLTKHPEIDESEKDLLLQEVKAEEGIKDNNKDTHWNQQNDLNDVERSGFESGTDSHSRQHKILCEQVVPENSLTKDQDDRLEESSFYDEKNMAHEERKSDVLESHHSSFQWTSVYESVLFKNAAPANNHCAADHLESITPLPSSLKRARPLRVGLSKRQKVRHLHDK